MDLVGKRFKHKLFGVGVVSAHEKGILTIDFPERTSKVVYNEENYRKFLVAEDPEVEAAILKEFADLKEAKQQQFINDVLAKQKKDEPKPEPEKTKAVPDAKTVAKKTTVKQERITGKPMTFYVFQGGTFAEESRGGYIWAPLSSKDGGAPHHWTRLLDVCQGDIIFHGYGGHVQAISVARGQCYECNQPEELRSEDQWELAGRRVDCEYIVLDNPIKTSNYREDILRICNVKYAPFDKDGNGNMGYLYELNRELAQIFMRAIVKANKSLADVGCIVELLRDEKCKDASEPMTII